MKKIRNYEILGSVELTDEEAELANKFIEEAEKKFKDRKLVEK